MTTPRVNTIKRNGARFYVNPDDARKFPGVTSVVDMLPKPFLTRWAAKSVAEFAVQHRAAYLGLVDAGEPEAAVNLLKDAPWRDTRASARTGDAAHKAFEAMAEGRTAAEAIAESEAEPDEVGPFARHFEEFLQEFSPEFLFMEEAVWSDTHAYAGSFDALMSVDGIKVWVDWKTTRSGVHAQVALQLAAYSRADFILRGDGSRVPLPKADKAACLLVRPEGWSLTPVRIDDDVFEAFLHLRGVFDWDKDLHSTVLGAPLNAKPITTPSGQLTAWAKRASAASRAA